MAWVAGRDPSTKHGVQYLNLSGNYAVSSPSNLVRYRLTVTYSTGSRIPSATKSILACRGRANKPKAGFDRG
jgi:hypothetical protein